MICWTIHGIGIEYPQLHGRKQINLHLFSSLSLRWYIKIWGWEVACDILGVEGRSLIPSFLLISSHSYSLFIFSAFPTAKLEDCWNLWFWSLLKSCLPFPTFWGPLLHSLSTCPSPSSNITFQEWVFQPVSDTAGIFRCWRFNAVKTHYLILSICPLPSKSQPSLEGGIKTCKSDSSSNVAIIFLSL